MALRPLRAQTERVRGAKIAVAVGLTLLLLGFAMGTWQPSTSVDGAAVPCDPAIDLTRLPFNELGAGPDEATGTPTAALRRLDAACQDATLQLRMMTWTAVAVGGLLALGGSTALREKRSADRRQPVGA